MEKCVLLRPEACYKIIQFTMGEISNLQARKESITALVLRYDFEKNGLIVYISERVKGFIPFEEISIYSIEKPQKNLISKEMTRLYYKIIRCKVIGINNDFVILSRRQSMLEGLDYINNNIGKIFNSLITGSTPHALYFDIALGINGICYIENLTISRLFFADDFAKRGSFLDVIVEPSTLNNCDNKFILFHKQIFGSEKDALKNYHQDQIIKGIIRNEVDHNEAIGITKGFFIEINPVVSGIADIPDGFERYGETANFVVLKVKNKGLKLKEF